MCPAGHNAEAMSRYSGRGDCDGMIAMKAAFKVRVVLMLVASCAASAAVAETESGSTPVPETVAPPGIIVMPPRLPAPMSVPAPQSRRAINPRTPVPRTIRSSS